MLSAQCILILQDIFPSAYFQSDFANNVQTFLAADASTMLLSVMNTHLSPYENMERMFRKRIKAHEEQSSFLFMSKDIHQLIRHRRILLL